MSGRVALSSDPRDASKVKKLSELLSKEGKDGAKEREPDVALLFASLASVAAMYFRQRILNWVAVALLLFSFSHFRISTGDVRQLTMTIVFVSTGVLGPYINALIAHLRKKNDGAAPS